MPTLPSATVSVVDESSPNGGGLDYLCVLAAVPSSDDVTPRVFAGAEGIYDLHGYSEGLEYAALHFEKTKKPLIFVGLPIVTAGAVSRQDDTGVTGTSAVSVAAGTDGVLSKHDGVLTVVTGGTIGTSQIVFDLSLDGGHTTQRVKLGTASSYAIPYVGVTISFAGGTLVADDVFTWSGSGPLWDSTGLADAKDALAAQTKLCRDWLVIGDLPSDTEASSIESEASAYASENERFVKARCNVRDRLPQAEMSRVTVRMTGSPNITFAEVGATGDTITRSSGSFITDGFVANDRITITGAVAGGGANNLTDVRITDVAASVLTLDTGDLVAEGPIAGVSISGTPAITFAEVGATGDTITRSRGSWTVDGFRAGDILTITGTASNNGTTAVIDTVTALVITLTSFDLAAESIGSNLITITAGETVAQYVAALDAEYTGIDAKPRINIGLGCRRIKSPITQWYFRRPVSWFDTIRSYQKELHVPTLRKSDGPLDGAINDDDLLEHDERVHGGALSARFTCFRTWANGPNGPFIAASLTRAAEGKVLQLDHNMAVVNVACATVHAETENAIGTVLQLKANGTATSGSLARLKARVDSALARALLQGFGGEGPRASYAAWTPAVDDDLSSPDATLNGVLDLKLNGTLMHVNTSVKVR